mmetsp:Transcript_22216/g.26672  ORF Transcript_22216/g.26672 Transcript_22216/m.26672 type:complete len:284 (-) Transcript_22216:984-1835(-)|eukprot:CAMPEP_0197854652 /NCGR_PEP_ID=MMETSP1438-20131217/25068_1 /TAXON_ID=1461541 /ORGANISM="Pterosperma sp., Strain CCMP1384" /LENGTH=283 /DNA_ID=CAMNT_0043469473 /DNA_START=491 /DNA_END=1342 /DNA_ORIENTATION=+
MSSGLRKSSFTNPKPAGGRRSSISPARGRNSVGGRSSLTKLPQKQGGTLSAENSEVEQEAPHRGRKGSVFHGKQYAAQLKKETDKDQKVIKLNTETVTKRDIEHLKSYFMDIDLDNSGTIDMDEIEQHMRETYQQQEAGSKVKFGTAFVKRIQEFIENKEEMQFTDMLRLVYPSAKEDHIELMTKLVAPPVVAEPPLLVPEEEDRFINSMWALWDADGSGELDHFEFRSVLRDINASQDDAEQFFEEIDLDKSGSISKQEFRDWWFGVGRYAKMKNDKKAARE